jgi:peptidoglycan DL-endopeptidase CwlO
MRYLVFIAFISASWFGNAQDKKIDQLEILYDQGYYSKVWHKSDKLMVMPEYDYSGLPAFYHALSLFRLANDEAWFKRHNYAIDEAVSAYRKFLESERIADYINAHYYEIASLKTYLVDLETKFEGLRLTAAAAQIQKFRLNELKGIKSRPDIIHDKRTNGEVANKDKLNEIENKDETVSNTNDNYKEFRQKMVVYAKSLVGVKYKWAGISPDGFDCSGFVGYVHQKYGFTLPRSASDQLAQAKKLKLDEAFMGDLVFFASGSTISHVGLVISNKGENLMMVHSSTSKGVIITEIPTSTYWQGKLKAAGTYL